MLIFYYFNIPRSMLMTVVRDAYATSPQHKVYKQTYILADWPLVEQCDGTGGQALLRFALRDVPELLGVLLSHRHTQSQAVTAIVQRYVGTFYITFTYISLDYF